MFSWHEAQAIANASVPEAVCAGDPRTIGLKVNQTALRETTGDYVQRNQTYPIF